VPWVPEALAAVSSILAQIIQRPDKPRSYGRF
jgi:hypothetical protein